VLRHDGGGGGGCDIELRELRCVGGGGCDIELRVLRCRLFLYMQDKDGRPLPDDAIRAEVDTFMFAGHDTTATALAWCLVTLAQYPEHQEQCRTEAQNVISSSSFSSSPDW